MSFPAPTHRLQNVQESVEWLWHDSQLIRLVEAFNETMFPDDYSAPDPPDVGERLEVRKQARTALLRTLPDVLVTLVGTTNARRGVGKLFDALQSDAMNKRLFYTLFEALLSKLFPELARRDLQLVTVTVDARETWMVAEEGSASGEDGHGASADATPSPVS